MQTMELGTKTYTVKISVFCQPNLDFGSEQYDVDVPVGGKVDAEAIFRAAREAIQKLGV